MKEAVFQITRSAYGKIKKYAEKTYPDEGCGVLLASSTGRIEDVYFANNTVSSGQALNHYRIDPLELYEIEKRAADARRGVEYRPEAWYDSKDRQA